MPSGSRFRPARADIRRRHRLMRRMMRIAGVNSEDLARVDGGLALIEARAKCAYCQYEEACQAWLNAHGDFRLPPGFCANARLFRALREAMGKRISSKGVESA